ASAVWMCDFMRSWSRIMASSSPRVILIATEGGSRSSSEPGPRKQQSNFFIILEPLFFCPLGVRLALICFTLAVVDEDRFYLAQVYTLHRGPPQRQSYTLFGRPSLGKFRVNL